MTKNNSFVNLFDRAIARARDRSYVRGILGRLESDSTYTILVSDRPGFVYVSVGPDGSQGVTIARNVGQVALRPGLPVKLREEQGVLIIIEPDRSSGLLDDDVDTPGVYGVRPHPLAAHNDVTITSPADGEVLTYDGTTSTWLNAVGGSALVTSVNTQTGAVVLDADDIDDTATTHKFATAAELADIASAVQPGDLATVATTGAYSDLSGTPTIPADTATAISGAATDDTIADADLWGYVTGGVLVKTAWSNIKATLKTYMDTLYTAINTAVLLTGTQDVAGIKRFSDRIGFGSVTGTPDASVHVLSPSGTSSILAQAVAAAGGALPFWLQAITGSTGVLIARFQHTPHNGWLDIEIDANGRVQLDSRDGARDMVLQPVGGNVGIRTAVPQGPLHVHDGTGGELFVTKTSVAGTAVTVIPDGTGDVTAGAYITGVVKPSTGTTMQFASGGALLPGGSGVQIFSIAGPHVVEAVVSAAGVLTVRRTAGDRTYTIAMHVIWI